MWSKTPRFTINLTLFNRLPLHPQVNDIIGDFTSLTLLAVDTAALDTFEARAKRLQEQLWQDMEHRYISGVRVLRELNRMQRGGFQALMPVIFTSTISLDSVAQAAAEPALPVTTVYSIGQTPQVWLDNQVAEHDGALTFNWDAVEGLFPEGLLDDMFDAYRRLLNLLAHETAGRAYTPEMLLPQRQLARRASVNATGGPVPGGLLHTLFVEQALRRPDDTAVITSERELTYQRGLPSCEPVGQSAAGCGGTPQHARRGGDGEGLGAGGRHPRDSHVGGRLPAGRPQSPRRAALLSPFARRSRVGSSRSLGSTNPSHGPKASGGCACRTSPSWTSLSRRLEPVQRQEDLAYVIYTSGSTGLPEGRRSSTTAARSTRSSTSTCTSTFRPPTACSRSRRSTSTSRSTTSSACSPRAARSSSRTRGPRASPRTGWT